ncbi:plasmid pRiA4b ORF-3 family protein [Nonomuraea sp. NPDC003804]|uniref:plasmid pRiA4b ORF-3 family protein n=1 Tax=Nonomuraea sp. NPDC003804 TaxID=3154547 RepID=UPI0033BFB29F
MSAVVNTVTVGTVHQLKVTLRGVRPPVWRRVHVPSTATLDQLHEVIQVAFGWEQHHLHLLALSSRSSGEVTSSSL